MLKKIQTRDLKLGMYLQSLEGSWLSHPFWKTRFVLDDPADLAALLSCGVPAVWIDTARGADVVAASAPAAPAPAVAAAPPIPAPEVGPARVAFGDELARAAQLVNRSRQAVMHLFGEARLGRAIDAEQCLPLVHEVAQSVARNPSALVSLARLKTKDDYTYMHSVAVCALMVALARQLGLDEAETREAGLAGLLHDVGKMMMPLEVLNKPGALDDAEFAVMRSHPVRGFEALREGGLVPLSALDVCLHHHEKMDGSGYPERLQGEQISLLARMGAVCDVYDAITSNRPYKAAWDPAGSIQRMAQWQGHFDPQVFQAFVRSIGIFPVGTLVKLASGRLAVVVEQNASSLVTPVVRVFYSTKSKLPVPVQMLDLALPASNDKIVGRESARDWGFTHLDEVWMRHA
ncbi:HD-GYP domain-containing protein [Roseateles sp. DAIF2]|uniref:HD-GYP domain-containing protein n=1 Tax=Roseateles sp. DAIF2 TaxID=2714952 RepID=UPI0018A2DBF8|nr:HD-GYP domain-containing protein [Roseateles sp. DAIF2]QPF75027.1 HD-GYP domain-containing protein [Roseateles sp. DAIF2]